MRLLNEFAFVFSLFHWNTRLTFSNWNHSFVNCASTRADAQYPIDWPSSWIIFSWIHRIEMNGVHTVAFHVKTRAAFVSLDVVSPHKHFFHFLLCEIDNMCARDLNQARTFECCWCHFLFYAHTPTMAADGKQSWKVKFIDIRLYLHHRFIWFHSFLLASPSILRFIGRPCHGHKWQSFSSASQTLLKLL